MPQETTTKSEQKESLTSNIEINVGSVSFLVANIVMNAAKHGNADQYSFTAKETNEKVIWEISDNGTGISQEALPNIFEEKFSGGGSTGIGLGQAPEKLAQFGASISAEANGGLENSTGGRGAKFIIELQKA